MKKTDVKKSILLLSVGALMASSVWAQADKSSRPSPPATATGKIGAATITIDYSSPSVKGRKIWGDLVPYDQAWRAGANEATIFSTDKAVKIGGKTLPAGKYSLFATPGKTDWEFIFNSQTGQWGIKQGGVANFDPSKNVLTVKVKSGKSENFNERLAYVVSAKGFALRWENLDVMVPISN